LARITGEHFREPDPQLGFLWGGLTMGMLLSVPMVIAGAVMIMMTWRRQPASRPDADGLSTDH
jgi:phosphatidylglycerol:prolipoprotein diacylglycerol transferase